MNVIRSVSDKILVLKTGKLIEYNYAEIVFNNPKDEYTKNLISSVVWFMAEREGFEPSVVLLLHTLSKRAD